MDIAIYGAGGFGREVKLIIDAINKKNEGTYNLIGFFDDKIEKGTIVNGIPVLGGINDLNDYSGLLAVTIAIGDPKNKFSVIKSIFNKQLVFPNLIHPNVSISNDDVDLGKGIIICEGSILTCNIKIEDYVVINLMCTVGHDSIIRAYSSIMPGVNVSGEVILGEKSYIGTGAKIINLVEIGENVVVGAGAVVSKSFPGNCTVVGVPAKVIKENKEIDFLFHK